MENYPKVLVSVLNYNSFENTVETIECYQHQTYPNFHLQLIDNGSTNDCVAKLKRRFPSFDIIQLHENLGYMGGANLALEMALEGGYDYVVVSNEDIAIEEDLLSNIVETAQKEKSVGVIGGIEVDYFTGHVRAAGGCGYNFWTSRANWLTSIPKSVDSAIEVDYVQSALVVFSRNALLAEVKLDPNLFIYCDEVDVGFQLKKCGLKAFLDRRCRIRHKSRPRLLNPRSGYFIQRNRLYLTSKYASSYVFAFNVLYTGLLELPIKVLRRSVQGHFAFSWACILGYIDGLRGKMGRGRGLSL